MSLSASNGTVVEVGALVDSMMLSAEVLVIVVPVLCIKPVEDAVVGAPDGLLLSSETGTDIGVATVMMLAVKDGVFTEASLEVSQYDGVVVMVIPVSDEVALKTLADEL